ncbi:putative Transmembrane protein [Mycena indigotica]|uniref:Putative Transmembrane protein n=1 Tax=Mycena indigotica TaxID=2126181 RepID=A0A8H6SLL3_9AGAR|nr:putative Transmembrane protein [Mycena indigotica]KAF7301873.1 putative Transmembrane protein [Mycena indigotica]
MPMDKLSMFRVISFTLAGGDFVQTIPDTLRLYRKQWVNRSLSPICVFYALARYMSALSLITNGVGFFGTSFTAASCKRFYMLPNVTAMLAGMSVQVLIYIRTYAISGRSKYVRWGLIGLLAVCMPLQVFGICYHRDPVLSSRGGCKGKVLHRGDPDWNIVYYSAHMAFDLVACATATFYLVFMSRMHGRFNMSKFLRRVLRNGLLYTFAVFAANFWVVLEFAGVLNTGAASTLPLAVVMIAAAHLILSTQRLHPAAPYTTSEDDAHTPNETGPAILFHHRTTHDLELDSNVYGNQNNKHLPSSNDSQDTSRHKGESQGSVTRTSEA